MRDAQNFCYRREVNTVEVVTADTSGTRGLLDIIPCDLFPFLWNSGCHLTLWFYPIFCKFQEVTLWLNPIFCETEDVTLWYDSFFCKIQDVILLCDPIPYSVRCRKWPYLEIKSHFLWNSGCYLTLSPNLVFCKIQEVTSWSNP